MGKQLADAIDRQSSEDGLSVSFCADSGRPSSPVCLIVALHDLKSQPQPVTTHPKYANDISDEAILDEWFESPY